MGCVASIFLLYLYSRERGEERRDKQGTHILSVLVTRDTIAIISIVSGIIIIILIVFLTIIVRRFSCWIS